VINVVTKSGAITGTAPDSISSATAASAAPPKPFMSFKPHSEQQQGGATLGGPIKKNKIFFFGGFDQHHFHVPT
jgi:hypothetical protein